MTDLSTSYLGLKLHNPIVVSSSSLTSSAEKIRALEEAGAGAVVLKSIFEEQLDVEAEKIAAATSLGQDFAEASSGYFPDIPLDVSPDDYVRLIGQAKKAVHVPVMASINCVRPGKWSEYAKKIEAAGADAIELNLYVVPTDPKRTGTELEQRYADVVHDVRKQVKLPIAVKLSPFFTSIPNVVARMAAAGAQGVVLFNRFYQPNFDLDEMKMSYALQLSRAEDALLPLRWIALLYGRVPVDLAATTGIHDGRTALKMILAGASVTQLASAIYKHKPGHIGFMLREMQEWMQIKEYASITELRGVLSQKSNPEPEAFERAQYIKVLVGHE